MSRPLDVLGRNLQSVLRWSCIEDRDRSGARAILARVLALEDADLEPLRLVALADRQDDVMHNLRAAETRVFVLASGTDRFRARPPLSMDPRWTLTRRGLRRDLAAWLREGLGNWETYVRVPIPDARGYAASALILHRRLAASRNELLAFAHALDNRNRAETGEKATTP